MPLLLSVNLARPRPNPAKPDVGATGIDKRPVDHPVELRPPGPKHTGLHSGLVGDAIFDTRNHGGEQPCFLRPDTATSADPQADMWSCRRPRGGLEHRCPPGRALDPPAGTTRPARGRNSTFPETQLNAPGGATERARGRN